MNQRSKGAIAAAALGLTLASGGAGAALYATTAGSPTTTTVREVAATPVAQTTSGGLTVGSIYARSARSVVEVDAATAAPAQFGPGQAQTATGTGFVYDTKGDIVTNAHVVAGASSISIKLADGSTLKATLVGEDASSDLAVIHVDGAKLPPLALADSAEVAVGDAVVAIGNPFGYYNSVTTGIVSALGREIVAPNDQPIENAIQTDAAINHGNSGGPLLDSQGHVIGVNAQIASDSGGNDGVGFAIPANTVKSVVAQILSTGNVQHALLGVGVKTVPATSAARAGATAGVAITKVNAGSGAARAGLKASTGTKTVAGLTYPTGGDTIVALDGQPVATAEALRAAIAANQPGDTVRLTVKRNGETRTVQVTLGARTD